MQSIRRSFVVVLALFASTVAAHAADTPLEAIPQEAGVVLRWQKPTETVKKAVEFAGQVAPERRALLQPLSLGIGVAISNPDLAGLDRERDWYVAVFPRAEGDPGIVFAIPATDTDAMKGGVEGKFEFAVYENWLLYAQEKELIEKIEARIGGEGKSIAGSIEQESTAAMDRNDLSVYLNVPQLRIIYKDQIDAAEEQVDAQLGQIQNFAPPTPGINLQPMLDMYGKVFRGMMQSFKETNGVVIGVSVAKDTLDIETVARVVADSGTDKFLQNNKKSDLQQLTRLPAGSHAYIGASGNVSEIANMGTRLSAAMYAGDEEMKKTMEEATKEMAKLDFGAFLMSFGISNSGGGIFRVANVTEVKPADKMRDLSRKLMQGMANVNVGPVKQKVELKADAENYGDYRGDLVTTKQEVDPELDPLGIQTQMQQILYGPDGQVQRVVYRKDSVAQTMGGGRGSMEQLLKSLDATGDETAGNPAAAATRAKLPEQANLVAMADLPALIVDAIDAVIQASQLPIPIDVAGLKKSIGDEHSYVGLSVAGAPQTAHVKIHIPVKQAQNAAKLVKEFQQLQQQQQQF